MSVEAQLDTAFATLLAKAQQTAVAGPPRTATINFEWVGGGQPIVLANLDPVMVEVPYPARIVWVHLYAGDAAGAPVLISATVELRVTQFGVFPGSSLLTGTGTLPTLTAAATAEADLTGWQTNLAIRDALIGRVKTFSGLASWLTLTMQLRSTDVPIGTSALIDSGSSSILDASGDTVILRS